LQTDPFTQLVEFLSGLLAPYGLSYLAVYLALVPFLIIIYVLYLIIVRSTRVGFRSVGMPREASTGVIFIIRLVFFSVTVLLVLSATTIAIGEAALTVGALMGTAIGLAFSRALSNLVSGMYVFAARPFRVGDYVRIGNIEGIVFEITLNYTRLRLPDYTRQYVPNSKVVDSEVTNYRVRIDDYMLERGKKYEDDYVPEGRLERAIDRFKDLTKGDEIFRYTFDISVHMSYDIDNVIISFDKVCDEWADRFLERPEFIYKENSNFGVIYAFAFITERPEEIITLGGDFQRDVAHTLLRERGAS
jgi:hypothetical protein